MRAHGKRGGGSFGTMACVAALLVAGCVEKPLPPYTASDTALTPSYKLGSSDKLRIDTFGEAALSGEFEVSGAGDISLPLIGSVPVSGRTTDELARAIEQGLRAGGYLTSPRVAVQVLNYRPFYILGEVAKPGSYPFSSGMTVLNAVATAQGFTYRANTTRIFIRRANEPAEQEVPLTAATPVLPGDTIRIAERHF